MEISFACLAKDDKSGKFRMLACCLVLPLHYSTGQASE